MYISGIGFPVGLCKLGSTLRFNCENEMDLLSTYLGRYLVKLSVYL